MQFYEITEWGPITLTLLLCVMVVMQVLVGIGPGDLLQKRQKLLMAVPRFTGCGDGAGGDLQRREQPGRAVAAVVMGAPLGPAGLHREHLLGSVQRLNLGLFIDAEHDRVLRRDQIEPDHVGDLGHQFGIGGELERLHSPRLHPVLAPSFGHGGVPDGEVAPEQARGPVRHPVLLRRRFQRGRHHLAVIHDPGPAGAVLVGQSGDPAGLIPVPPPQHRRPRHPDPFRR